MLCGGQMSKMSWKDICTVLHACHVFKQELLVGAQLGLLLHLDWTKGWRFPGCTDDFAAIIFFCGWFWSQIPRSSDWSIHRLSEWSLYGVFFFCAGFFGNVMSYACINSDSGLTHSIWSHLFVLQLLFLVDDGDDVWGFCVRYMDFLFLIMPRNKCMDFHVLRRAVKREAAFCQVLCTCIFWWSKGGKLCLIQLVSRRGHYESLMCIPLLCPSHFFSLSVRLCISPLRLSSLIALTCFVLLLKRFGSRIKNIINMILCHEKKKASIWSYSEHVLRNPDENWKWFIYPSILIDVMISARNFAQWLFCEHVLHVTLNCH